MFEELSGFHDGLLLLLPDMTQEQEEAFLKKMNPWNDPTLDEFMLLRLNIARELTARSGRFRETYWRRLSQWDLLVADGEAQWLYEFYNQVLAAERGYLIETYLDSELEVFDAWVADKPKFAADMRRTMLKTQREHSIYASFQERTGMTILDESQTAEAMLRAWLTLGHLPPRNPIHVEYAEAVRLQSQGADLPDVLTNPVTTEAATELRVWREELGPLHYATRNHWEGLIEEFVRSKGDSALKGKAGESRLLFVNDKVPLPRDETFLAWSAISTICFRWLDDREINAMRVMCGWRPESILTFLLPAMPMTKEHIVGSLIQTDDSTANQSLSARSAAHKRDDDGKIRFGQWRARTVILGASTDQIHVVCDEPLATLQENPMGIHERHLDMLPYARSSIGDYMRGKSSRDVFAPGLGIDTLGQTTSFIHDVGFAQPTGLPIHWALFTSEVGMPWKSLAKFHRTHFRFDWDEAGQAAAAHWTLHFIQTAHRWLYSENDERLRNRLFNLNRNHRLHRNRPEISTMKTTGGGETTIDLSGFKDFL